MAIISQRIKDINYPIIVSFFVYSPFNGNQLNISNVCQNEKLSVEEDISLKIEDKDKYYFIEYLTKQNMFLIYQVIFILIFAFILILQ